MYVDYQTIYNNVYGRNPSYSAADNSPCKRYAERALELSGLSKENIDYVVDIGGGQGLLKEFIPKASYSVLDVSPAALSLVDKEIISVIQGDITKRLPFSAYSIKFDLGYCFDVLEHLQPKDLPQAFQNLQSLAPVVIGSISMRAANNNDYLGRNLHLTVADETFWSNGLMAHAIEVKTLAVEDSTLLFYCKTR